MTIEIRNLWRRDPELQCEVTTAGKTYTVYGRRAGDAWSYTIWAPGKRPGWRRVVSRLAAKRLYAEVTGAVDRARVEG